MVGSFALPQPRANRTIRIALAAVLCVAFFFLAASSASAASGRSLLDTISVGVNSNPAGVAVDSSGNVYTVTSDSQPRILKFDSSGNPAPFSASVPYVSGNAILGTTSGSLGIQPGFFVRLAVDQSGGADDGNIYLLRSNQQTTAVLVFDSTGAYLGTLGPELAFGPHQFCGIDVNQSNGAVYVADYSESAVQRYAAPGSNPASASPNGTLHALLCDIAVDTSGAVYTAGGGVGKYEASEFGATTPSRTPIDSDSGTFLTIDPTTDDIYVTNGSVLWVLDSTGVHQGSIFGSLNGSPGVASDGDGHIFAAEAQGAIFVFGTAELQLPVATTEDPQKVTFGSAEGHGTVDPDSAGTITGCEFRWGEDSGYSTGSAPCSPGGPINSPTAVTANLTGLVSGTTYRYRVFVTNANGTQASPERTFFTPSAIDGVSTGGATGVTNQGADLNGSFSGDGSDTHYYFEWGSTLAYGQKTPAPPGNDAGSAAGFQTVDPVHISGLVGGTTYHFRLVAEDADGISRGQDEVFTSAPAVTNLTTDPPTNITDTSAQLHGSFDADSHETTYYFEWGSSSAYGQTTSEGTIPAGSGRVNVPPKAITGLVSGGTYHYRLVAENSLGVTFGSDVVFKAAEAPLVSNISTRDVLETSAVLLGEINPRYGETSYHFEWGPTAGYGNSVPVPDGQLAGVDKFLPVSAPVEGLTPGVTYHFRLVATNAYGTTASLDQTFSFYPPQCPNAQLRQETGSNDLPDCRAYELVSPSNARGTLFLPLGGPTTSYANSPARLAYTGNLGTLDEESGKGANTTGDLYVSTRTDEGWTQRYIGRNDTFQMGNPPINYIQEYFQSPIGMSKIQRDIYTDPELDRIVQWDRGFGSGGLQGQKGHPSNVPYVWDSTTGALLDRWPTNFADVEGGYDFVGLPMPSGDLSHFVFSSNVVFADGGTGFAESIGCCQSSNFPPLPPASIYDNKIADRSVALASVKKNGSPFLGYLYDVSKDGSTIVMAEGNFRDKLITGPIYVRIDGGRTEEFAAGKQIHYVGATDDDRTIYITSTAQLTPGDTDSSEDLYRWTASNPDALTLVSVGDGGGRGNSNGCNVNWNSGGCGVQFPDFTEYSQGLSGEGGNSHSDVFIAPDSGDIYFMSPEKLIGANGEANQPNLYVYRHGQLGYVTTMEWKTLCTIFDFYGACTSGPIARMQITPSGSHMGIVTNSHLTGYDSGERAEMYLFTPDNGRLLCASCRPDGKPPIFDVTASQNGRFLTDDGRAFFTSEDSLVPRDTNGNEDIYEFTQGKPWLITTGVGPNIRGLAGYLGTTTRPGLINVSANGTDVYFASIDTLVSQDANGSNIKIYDARTGGGFPAVRIPPNCPAADECHGPVANQPDLPPDRTSANLGQTKKKAHKKKHCKKKKKQCKKHKKHKKGKKTANKRSAKQGGKHRG
ncbi:MAG TPA: hypothetical protein VFJ61_04160 [Solirubrobacterales bacterium]|nr:hypothetical protein [Solirubrobacterales bacterium]